MNALLLMQALYMFALASELAKIWRRILGRFAVSSQK